jgi:uncharacterized membrane protein
MFRRVSLDLAVVRFGKQGAAVQAYAAARDRLSTRVVPDPHPQWMRDVGFVERHHNGHLLVRGTFAGHYVDVDESDDVSDRGGREGAAAGGLVGVLLGPPGIAVGLLLGAIVGAQVGNPKELEAEPEPLVSRLREEIPRSSSAIVTIAPAPVVDEMLEALGEDAKDVVRRALAGGESAALDASLSAAPPTPGA